MSAALKLTVIIVVVSVVMLATEENAA